MVDSQSSSPSRFQLLSDSPRTKGPDPLGGEELARHLEDLILASRSSAPFTVSVEGGWGTGKSTVMLRLRKRLEQQEAIDVHTVWFNAWTAREDEALEALVRSVLETLDPNILRRAARNKRLLRGVGLAISATAAVLGIGSVVDRVWSTLELDPTKRNDINEFVRDAMEQWLGRVRGKEGRLIVVFIDDLDRCTAPTVMQIFEAVKLYLDAPGFVFILGWDTEQVLQSVAAIRGGEDRLPQRYVEKIVQFGFRVPRPTDEQLSRLVDEYCDQAGITEEVLATEHRQLLIRTTNANPRQLVRFINRFILLHEITMIRVDAATLIRLLVLQSSYDGFYRLLSQTDSQYMRNPITEFVDYLTARDAHEQHRLAELHDVLVRYDIDMPNDFGSEEAERLFTSFERQRPREFQPLSADNDFVQLMSSTAVQERDHLWRLARSVELESLNMPADGPGAKDRDVVMGDRNIVLKVGSPFLRSEKKVLWIDDKPKAEDHELLPPGVVPVVATSQLEAERHFARHGSAAGGFSLVISDIGRGHDRNAGIDGLRRLRELGYAGPAVFYTLGTTIEQEDLAVGLAAQIAETPRELQAIAQSILAASVTDPGRRMEELAASEEAVAHYRRLVQANPAAYLPDLAASLNNLSVLLAGIGRREDALVANEEAVQLYRGLADTRPDAFLPDLAGSLNALSSRLAESGRDDEARIAREESRHLIDRIE